MNKFGFAGGSSQTQVDAAIAAYRKFEDLMVRLTAEEKQQVMDKTPIHDMREWGTWE